MTFPLVVVSSIAVYVIIGVIAGRRLRNKADYFVAGRNAPTLLITGTLVASLVSSVGFTGDVGLVYDGYLIIHLIIQSLAVSGFLLGVVVFGRYLRRSQTLTLPEYFGRRFDSRALQVVAGITVVIGMGIYLIGVTHGVGLVLAEILNIDSTLTVIIVWAGFTAFTVFSGSPGVLLTDTVMFVVFVTAGVLGGAWVIAEAGGPSDVVATVTGMDAKPDAMSLHGLTGSEAYLGTPTEAVVYAVIIGVVWAFVPIVSPWQSSRHLMARSEHTSIRGAAFAVGAYLPFILLTAFAAISINVLNADIAPSESAFIWAAHNVIPVWLGAILVAGIAAAGLSTASTFLSLIGFSVSEDIVGVLRRERSGAVARHGHTEVAGDQGQVRTAVTEEQGTTVRYVRLVMLASSVVVLALTLATPAAILDIVWFAATLFAASWGPVALMSVFSKRTTARGALSGMITGFVTVAGLEIGETVVGANLPIFLHPAIVGFVLCWMAVAVGNRGRQPSEAALAFRQRIIATPVVEKSVDEVRKTKRSLALLAAMVVGSGVLLYYLYHAPLMNIAQ